MIAQDDVFQAKHVVDGALSPDGSCAVYQLSEVVSGTTQEADQQRNSLWRLELVERVRTCLIDTDHDATAPQFTPDGESILFLSGQQVHRVGIDGGRLTPLTSLDPGVSSYALSPDGEWLALIASLPKAATTGSTEHVRITRTIYRVEGTPGYLHEASQAIYLARAQGGEPRRLTADDGLVRALAWSPDSKRIAAFVIARESHTISPMLGELCVVDLEGNTFTLLEPASVLGLFWTADGRQIGYAGWPDGNFSLQPQLHLIDVTGGAPLSRTPSMNGAVGRLIETHNPTAPMGVRMRRAADTAAVITTVTQGGTTGLCEIALSGVQSYRSVVNGPRTCEVLDVVGHRLLFSAQDFCSPAELYLADLRSGEECRLTNHNLTRLRPPRVEHIRARTAPGIEIEGWMLLPQASRGPQKTLLFIHGGPHFGFGYAFNEDFHEMLAAGYAVACANPRGSSGYGDRFSTAIVGRWGELELQDLNAFLDELIERGLADADRLGVTGQSGGGHLTAWLIGHTDRFKAAVPEQGVYNLVSMYGVSDAGIHLVTLEMDGPPHARWQRYWELSPIAHAHRCKTPTLLIQGESDLRCPMEQAEQLYAVLRQNGCEVELLRLKDCCHGQELYGSPALRRLRLAVFKDWFGRYIR